MVDGQTLTPRGEPPLLLALESATSVQSAALLRGEELLDEEPAAPGPAAETLLPAIDALLRRAEVDAVTALAVSVGPGSFTSLRVGIATAKGLAFATECAVAGVSTLAALARVAPGIDATVVPMLDARRGEVYAAAYARVSGEDRTVIPEGVYTVDALCARLPAACVLVGEGVALVGAAIRDRLGAGVDLIPPPEGVPAARHVGVLGARLLARGSGLAAADLVPHYLRRAEAEVKRTGARFESPPACFEDP